MSLTLLQWNCMFSENPDKIAAFIADLKPDIICLQELTEGYHDVSPGTGEYIAARLGYQAHCAYGPMVLPDGTSTRMGNGILSRLPLERTDVLILQKGDVQDGRVTVHERMYVEATVIVDGREVTIGTTHLAFHPRFITTRYKQAMMDKIVEHFPSAGANYILAADFNAQPHSRAALSPRQHGLRNAGPALRHPTWTTKPFEIGPWLYDELRWRLDYVLYRGGLKPVKSEIVQTRLSDHLPILAEFELL
jgi:endonuclease/exonuclease/phosphatase family metal-dependent hydrolase